MHMMTEQHSMSLLIDGREALRVNRAPDLWIPRCAPGGPLRSWHAATDRWTGVRRGRCWGGGWPRWRCAVRADHRWIAGLYSRRGRRWFKPSVARVGAARRVRGVPALIVAPVRMGARVAGWEPSRHRDSGRRNRHLDLGAGARHAEPADGASTSRHDANLDAGRAGCGVRFESGRNVGALLAGGRRNRPGRIAHHHRGRRDSAGSVRVVARRAVARLRVSRRGQQLGGYRSHIDERPTNMGAVACQRRGRRRTGHLARRPLDRISLRPDRSA